MDGLWWAWRVGSGRWGLRRRPAVKAPGLGVGADRQEWVATDGESRGRAGGRLPLGVRTLALTVVLGFAALCLLGFAELGSCVFMAEEPCGYGWGGVVAALIPATGCLVAGLAKAWSVGTGRSRPGQDRSGSAEERFPAEPVPAWLVAEPGADLKG